MDAYDDIKLACKDLCLFSDKGNGQLSSLISRLESVGTKLRKLTDINNKEIAVSIVVSLVDAYFYCLTCTKVSKPIWKVLSNVPSCLQSTVETQMTVKTREIIMDLLSLNKVSSLLEQSKSGRSLIHQHLSELCNCLSSYLKTTLSAPPSSLTQRDTTHLMVAVKVSLQMVQHFREDVLDVIQLIEVSQKSEVKEKFSELIQMLLTLLSRNGYDMDIYLFSGTTLAMLLNLTLDPHTAVDSFWTVIKVLISGCGMCKIGNLSLNVENVGDYEQSEMSELALVRAVIVCCKEDILTSISQQFYHNEFKGSEDNSWYGPRGDNPLLLTLFPVVLRYCNDEKLSQYHSFQVLKLWFQRLQKCWSQSNFLKNVSFTSKESPYLRDTLKQVFLNWDSPVDGVTDYVWEIFQCVLIIWRMEKADRRTDCDHLTEELLHQLLDIPWNVKGKYKLIGHLLPYTDIRQILQTTRLKQHLFLCMGSNNLAPIASDVYKGCLMETENLPDDQRLEEWKECWLDDLLHGLSSDDLLLCKKLSDYWIPLTLKLLPASVTFLPSYLCDRLNEDGRNRRRLLYVWLLVIRIIRSSRGTEEKDFNVILLTESLYSEDEDTRGEVVAFLCGSMKKSELLNETECQLLKTCLPLCLRVDSAPFRQHLTANMKKLMVRLRDGCLSAIKKKQDILLETALKFLDWLYGMLIDSLFPGASFQRRKTCLDILAVIYDTLVYVPGDTTQHRGQAGERSLPVLDYANNLGLCQFFTQKATVAVLSCVMDGADEVQELSSQLLLRFFPLCVPHPPYSLSDQACHLLYMALQLCSSPRPYESRSGALLCTILYIKYACEQNAVFRRHTGGMGSSSFICDVTEHPSGYEFLELLQTEIQQSITQAEEDPVKSSKESSLHGLIQAVTLCLRSRPLHADLPHLLIDLLKVNVKVIEMMMSVMAGGKTKESCPSFADMGMALEHLLSDGEGESLCLSSDFQIMLSWCWVNLKETCTCLGELTSVLVKSPNSTKWLSDFQSVGQVFIQVLTNCRVRGAIEGCRNGLLKYCTVLLASEDKSLSTIPAEILKQILTSLESSVKLASVTRRSAGLPIIVQVIAQAEHKLKQHHLLMSTVETLFHLASLPFCPETDQKQDLVQVHALNILKAVFGDASLVVSLMSYYTRVILIILHGFESPSWAIRNAATQLFGTMVSRMFGPRSKGGSGQNIMTLPELSAHYPGLPVAMLESLTMGITDVQSIDSLQPSLFLVLTLLANLGPVESPQSGHSYDHQFKEKIAVCLETPVYTLRELSARAFVAFVPLNTGEQELMHLVSCLPSSFTENSSHNHLHGLLLCIEKLLISREVSVKMKQKLLTVFLNKSWILTEMCHCPLLSAKYVQILRYLIVDLALEDSEMDRILDLLRNHHTDDQSKTLQIGTGLVIKDSVLCLTDLLKDRQTELTQLLCVWLCSKSSDVSLTVLNVLRDLVKRNQTTRVNWTVLQMALWNVLQTVPDVRVQTAAMHLLCDIRLNQLAPTEIHITLNDLQSVMSQSTDRRSSLYAAAIPVEAILIDNTLKSEEIWDKSLISRIHAWCERVSSSSDPTNSEDLRSASVTGLVIAGEIIFTLFSRDKSLPEEILKLLIESVFQLLEDGDSDIRKMAARFVSCLQWDQRQVQFDNINSTTCQQVFCEYIIDNLSWSVTVVQFLLEKIYIPGEVTRACENNRITSRCEVLFEQEESSVLSERPLQQVLLYTTVKTLFTKEAVIPETYLSSVVTEILTDLESCLPFMEKHLEGSPFMNVSCDNGVLSSLTGLVLVSDVMITHATNVDNMAVLGLKKGLTMLKQMNNLHPWLQSRLTDCQMFI